MLKKHLERFHDFSMCLCMRLLTLTLERIGKMKLGPFESFTNRFALLTLEKCQILSYNNAQK